MVQSDSKRDSHTSSDTFSEIEFTSGSANMNGTEDTKAHRGRQFVGAIDQGTTSSRFLIFDEHGEVVTSHNIEFKQIYPKPG